MELDLPEHREGFDGQWAYRWYATLVACQARGRILAGIQTHDGWVHSIQVNPYGRTAARCWEDGAIKLGIYRAGSASPY